MTSVQIFTKYLNELLPFSTDVWRLRFGPGKTVASCTRLWPLQLCLFLPFSKPSTLTALAMSGDGCRCACGIAGGSPGVAFTAQQNGVSGPSAGDLCAVGTRHSAEQDGRQQ